MLNHIINTHKTIEKHLEMDISDPVSDLLFLRLPCHPLQGEVELNNPIITKYERKTVTSVDWRTPIQPADVMLIAFDTTLNYNHIHMNFFKKILGYEKDLSERIKEFKTRGTLFEVIQTTRNIKLQMSTITFLEDGDNYSLEFRGDKEEEYQLPIHLNMNVVAFTINKAGKQFACFEWQLQQETQHVGCYMQPEAKKDFKEILCQILKKMSKDQHIKDHLVFCKQLAGIPVYKSEVKTNKNVSSGISTEVKQQLNDILIQEAQRKENKMVHTCSYYHVQLRERKLVLETAIFVLRSQVDYEYEFQVINATGYTVLKKSIDSGLNYEINVEKGYIRWIDVDHDCRIVEVNFQGKRDAALSLKYNMFQVMYQLKARRKIQEEVTSEELAYMKKISDEEPKQDMLKSKICTIYQEKEQIEEIGEKNIFFEDVEIKEGMNYNNFCQAKILDFSIASLGSLMETLTINEDGHIKQNDKRRLYDREGRQVQIGELLLHDSDSKAFVRGANGKIYNQDLIKSKLVEEYDPSPKKGIVSICPEYKMADVATFKTFKAIAENAIYEMDPRTKQGVGSLKEYTGNPQFTSINATCNGSFVTGAKNGEIRFFKQIGKNANNKFTSAGDPVIHLDTTKDGKWVLATFRRYLRLIPTENDDEISLFDKKINLNDRPTPIKLEVSLIDLQRFAIKDFCFLPAKFDESKESIERFIISGFGEYTVIWNLGKTIKGDRTYLISKGEGKVVQADFRFNDPTKLIMATSQGILVKENKIKK